MGKRDMCVNTYSTFVSVVRVPKSIICDLFVVLVVTVEMGKVNIFPFNLIHFVNSMD